MSDQIVINGLELRARIGVPAEERERPQRLTLSLELEPENDFADLEDRIERTVDYAAVCTRVQEMVAVSSWQLIESLAEQIAREILQHFAIKSINLELRKYVLPETNYVAVRLRRSRVEQ